jgi:hypothetical protein
MQRVMLGLIAVMTMLGTHAVRAAGDAKAEELLKQARAALGGEKSIARVQALSCTGAVQRTIGDRQVSGEVAINLQLPDKMLRTESISPMGDLVMVTEQGVNGDTLLRSARTMNAPPGAVIRMPPPPERGSDAEAQALRASRADLARLAAVMLLTSTPAMPIEFVYGGEAESPDGKADVLDLKGAGAFAAKMFFDKATHRPLMLAYRGVAPRVVMQTQRGGPPPTDAGRAPAAPPTPEVVDISLFVDDYKSVDGVMLPHRMTRSVGGETNEEVTCTTMKVNPAFKPDTFAGK